MELVIKTRVKKNVRREHKTLEMEQISENIENSANKLASE